MRLLLTLFLISLLLFTGSAFAQSQTTGATIEFAPRLSGKDHGRFITVMATTSEYIYLNVWVKRKPYLVKMDHDYHVVYKKPVHMGADGSDRRFLQMSLHDDKIHVFSYTYDRNTSRRDLYCNMLNEEDLSARGGSKNIAFVHSFPSHAMYVRLSWLGVSLFPEQGRILVTDLHSSEKEVKIMNLKVLDADLNAVWQREISFPYGPQDVEFQSALLDDDGSVVFFANTHGSPQLPDGTTQSNAASLTFHMLVARSEQDTIEDHIIDSKGKVLQSVRMRSDVDGSITCIGFYGNHDRLTSGLFLLRMDPFKNVSLI